MMKFVLKCYGISCELLIKILKTKKLGQILSVVFSDPVTLFAAHFVVKSHFLVFGDTIKMFVFILAISKEIIGFRICKMPIYCVCFTYLL